MSLSKVSIFLNVPTLQEKKSLNKCCTDKFAKNNTQLNNPVLTQCEKTRSVFPVEASSFRGIVQYILQGTNDS